MQFSPPPNTCLNGDGFHVSYNWGDSQYYGDVTTALVLGQVEKCYILNGDHRKQYSPLISDGFEACMSYFEANIKSINKTSKKSPEACMRIQKKDGHRQSDYYVPNRKGPRRNLNDCVVTGIDTEALLNGIPFHGPSYGDGRFLIWCAANEPDLLETPQRVAVDFYHRLKAHFTPKQWLKVRVDNAKNSDADICHSHDVCDANMHMLASYGAVTGDEDDLLDAAAMERFVDMSNQAWPIAKLLMIKSLSYTAVQSPVRNPETFGDYSFKKPAHAIVDGGRVVAWSENKKFMQVKLAIEQRHGSHYSAELIEYTKLPLNLVAVEPTPQLGNVSSKESIYSEGPSP